jgi:hypothetical protein
MCLDVFNGGFWNNHTHLAPCANFSGQLWRPIRSAVRASEPYVRLTTKFLGDAWCLGYTHYSRVLLTQCGGGVPTRQYWSLKRTNLRVKRMRPS